jgi:hypothetical protein
MRSVLLACIALLALGASLPSVAHHSTANFDMTKAITITGKVTYFAFTNPHSYFDMDVTDKKGQVVHYKIFTVAKVVMTRNGWTIGDLKAGDNVTVIGNPDRKEPHYMYLQKITFAGGKEWSRERVF